jgi:hypothetical protein
METLLAKTMLLMAVHVMMLMLMITMMAMTTTMMMACMSLLVSAANHDSTCLSDLNRTTHGHIMQKQQQR